MEDSYYGCNTIKKEVEIIETTLKDGVYSENKKPKAFLPQRGGSILYVYNGEKNLGELGPPKEYYLDLPSIRTRGGQAYLENKVAQIICNRTVSWVIGTGLRLECEPNKLVLESEGIDLDFQKFSDSVEARYTLLKESKLSTWSGVKNLSLLEESIFRDSFNKGDMLVILRVINGIVKYQVINGKHVCYSNPEYKGNHVVNGVEMNDKGEHIAYWVKNRMGGFDRMEAKNKSTGLTMAFLYGGWEFDGEFNRRLPVLAGLFETLNGMDKYETATIGSAEEQNRIPYQAVYGIGANTENPFIRDLASAIDGDGNDGTMPMDSQLQALADKVQVSTNKQTFAMPEGSELKPLTKSEAELYFKDFFTVIFEYVSAAGGLPPDLARGKFDASYSAARAAIKDGEHTFGIKRYKHGFEFLQPGYELQLHVDIINGKIQAPGYLKAFMEGNEIVLLAYRQCRWVGDNMFHVDPVKEVEAIRRKLGPAFDHVPLSTVKKVTEQLSEGNSAYNIPDAGEELKLAETHGIKSQSNGSEKPPIKEEDNQGQ